jgi:peptidoglycan DL-endopeptidase CwlO
VSNHHAGRHRAQGRQTTANALTSALSRSGQPAAKASAVLAVSGGLVASFSLPASAAPLPGHVDAASSTADTVAVAAPRVDAPVVSPSFGEVGFTGVAPKPVAPKPERQTVAVSRDTQRLAINVAPPTAGVLGIAASLAGVPYTWGGTSPQEGFDCSGFTQYVFGKLGISLPRTAEDQRMAVTRVSTPQPGDLVFFGNPAHHVGIYAGGGMMWDAPHSGTVVQKRPVFSDTVSYGRPS